MKISGWMMVTAICVALPNVASADTAATARTSSVARALAAPLARRAPTMETRKRKATASEGQAVTIVADANGRVASHLAAELAAETAASATAGDDASTPKATRDARAMDDRRQHSLPFVVNPDARAVTQVTRITGATPGAAAARKFWAAIQAHADLRAGDAKK